MKQLFNTDTAAVIFIITGVCLLLTLVPWSDIINHRRK